MEEADQTDRTGRKKMTGCKYPLYRISLNTSSLPLIDILVFLPTHRPLEPPSEKQTYQKGKKKHKQNIRENAFVSLTISPVPPIRGISSRSSSMGGRSVSAKRWNPH